MNKLVIIGNGNEDMYLKAILKKLNEHGYIYIQTFIYPERLSMINTFFNVYFKRMGVRKRMKFMDIEIPDRKIPNTFITARIFRWDNIPRIMDYRSEINAEEESDRTARL